MKDNKKYRVDLYWGIDYINKGELIKEIHSVDSEETDNFEEAKQWVSSAYFGEIYDNETNVKLH